VDRSAKDLGLFVLVGSMEPGNKVLWGRRAVERELTNHLLQAVVNKIKCHHAITMLDAANE